MKGFNIKMNNKIIVGAIFCVFAVDFSTGWQGHYMTVLRSSWTWHSYCTCWYWWWGCSQYGFYWRTYYYKEYQCQPGWTHDGDRNCNIPVCRPACKNGGTCVSPNRCKCPSTSPGEYTGCSQLTCSYRRPCYPGDCTSGSACTCEDGFLLNSTENGCTNFDPSHTELQPVVGRSNVTLFHMRRTDNRLDYMFVLEGTNRSPDKLEIVWSNQRRFNRLRFEYESYVQQPQNLPERPNYVSDTGVGIVKSFIELNISKVPRQQSALMRDPGSFESYPCEGGFSANNPAVELATCTVDDQFKSLIEHGDWLNVKFKTNSGGFQKLINLDNQGSYFATKYFKGLQDVKEVQFQFDFDAPKHCSEPKVTEVCPTGSVMLRLEKEFTKEPIKTYWLGWIDDMSGVYGYYLEVFKLSPDPHDRLTEMTPLDPVFHYFITHSEKIQYPEYRPTEAGMYSVLLQTRDLANNSRIARRFVLFDDVSEVSLNNDADSRLYVGSAVAETGHMWLTPSSGQDLEINVFWRNHFVNHIHDKNKLLNEILDYPIQFKEIQDDGILSSQKYVAAALDDNEGHRTKYAINNYHGIVKFEIGKEYTLSDDEPDRWEKVDPLDEHISFRQKLPDGARMRIWIRATDIMGNTRTDSTLIRVDGTPPTVSRIDSKEHKVELNIENGAYNYTSRLLFAASDANSGVFKLSFSIVVSTQEKEGRLVYNGTSLAMTADMASPFCINVEGTCFVRSQQLDLDNCWFMTSKDELDKSTALVNVTVYNQALLSASTQFNIGPINRLKGLEKYNGPENIRIESPSPNGFRVAWDLPETTSCYGRAEIVIVLLRRGLCGDTKIETYSTTVSTKYLDILCLDPSTEYKVEFTIKSSALQEDTKVLSAKTAEPIDPGASTGSTTGPSVAQSTMAFQQLVPLWATEMLEEIKHIKQRMLTVDNIDKTVNLINVKVTDLENNFKSLEKLVSENVSTCKFIAESYDSTQEDLTVAKSEIKALKKMCLSLEEKSTNLESEKTELMDKITKLEMRCNGKKLMFYGINENENEDCKQLIRNMWTEHLEMTKDEADAVKVVRAHTVDGKKRGASKQKDSEKGIGVRWQKPIRDKRRELIPTMKSLRKNPRFKEKDVRLVVDKLMVDGKEYTGPRVSTTDDTSA